MMLKQIKIKEEEEDNDKMPKLACVLRMLHFSVFTLLLV